MKEALLVRIYLFKVCLSIKNIGHDCVNMIISSIVNKAIRTISNFLRRDFEQKKTQNKELTSSYKVFVRKKLILLLFNVRLILICWLVLACCVFFVLQNFLLKTFVLIASFNILLTCTPINPPIEKLFVRPYFYL